MQTEVKQEISKIRATRIEVLELLLKRFSEDAGIAYSLNAIAVAEMLTCSGMVISSLLGMLTTLMGPDIARETLSDWTKAVSADAETAIKKHSS